MNKVFSIILSISLILTGLTISVSAQSITCDISKGNISITTAGVSGFDSSGSAVSGIYDEYIITGTSANANSVTVSSGTHNITLSSLSITATNQGNGSVAPYICPVSLTSGVSVNFSVSGTNQLAGSYSRAAINVPSGASATFSGSGTLTVNTGWYGAGIGGSQGFAGGTITFNSGTYNITGGYNASGVGGANGRSGGTITINGGTVNSTAGSYGAALGGGGGDGAGTLTKITGGKVKAVGGSAGAGIGGGNGGNGGSVQISGGEITANGGSGAAGIGGSNASSCGTITISGGTVSATGGAGSAGIGGGGNNGAGGTVNITGGVVTATAGTINKTYSGEAIGRGGYNEGTTPKSSGTRNFGGAANIYAGTNAASAVYVTQYTGQPYVRTLFNNFNIADGSMYITSTGFRRSLGGTESPYTGEYVISGTSDANLISIESGSQAVTLRDLAIQSSANAMSISAGASATITLQGKSTLNSGSDKAGIRVPAGASITIGGSSAAVNAIGGIGGNSGEGSGAITITSGAINAVGGISGTVTITGGSVKGGVTGTVTNNTAPVQLVTIPEAVLGNATRLYTATVTGSSYSYTGYGHGDGDRNLYFYLPAGLNANSVTVQRVGAYPDNMEFTVAQFTDGAGNVVGTFKSDTTLNANVKIYNDTGSDHPAVFAGGVYNKAGALIACALAQTESGIISDGDTVILPLLFDMSDAKYADAAIVKTFVWTDSKSAQPLLKGKIIDKYEPRVFTFGTLQNQASRLATNRAAGLNTALLELSWGSFYSADGVKNTAYIAGRKQLLADMRAAGFKIQLGLGTQYPPSWIYNYPNSRFVNQYGDVYSTAESGDIAVNAVFNNAMRLKIAEYVNDVFAELGTDFDQVRLGWMRYGEIGYPNQAFNGHTNSYWAFDPYAQGTMTGLPAGIPVCPVPGWIPGTATTNHNSARLFSNWYNDALLNYQNWQIDLISSYTTAYLPVLYPSWGTREGQIDNAINVDLNGSTSPEKNGEVQRGFDFKRLILGITNPKAVVYCTWIDANPSWTSGDDQTIPTTSNNFSPVHYMAYYAKANSLKLKVMGENTGGGGMSAMTLTFQRMKLYDLDGVMWAFEPDLYDGTAPVLNDYKTLIDDYVATMDNK